MSHSSRVRDTVAEWQTRLLQLNKRNNLLNFKPKRAVRILNRAGDAFARELSSSRTGLRFDYVEPKRGAEPPEEPDIRGDIDVDLPLVKLQQRLGTLRKRDKEFEEEQGLNVLFVSIGVLHWMDEDGERMLSPLLLLPCDLLRSSPREPFGFSARTRTR